MNKNIAVTSIGILLLAGVTYAVWVSFAKQTATLAPEEGTVCTMEAFQCADGTWVGHTGPQCEFMCPTASSSTSHEATGSSISLRLNQSGSAQGVKITPLAIVEDSRCPTDVQCIQAGTVRVRVQVMSGLGVASEILKLDTPLTTEAETITLTSVTPLKKSTQTIVPSDYQFTFKITKR